MSKSSDSLLGFNDFENFGESPQISVNSPKKANSNNGSSTFLNLIVYKNVTKTYRFRGYASHAGKSIGVPAGVLPTVL